MELADINSVSYRRNPNKPPESTDDQSHTNMLNGTPLLALDPKSDDDEEEISVQTDSNQTITEDTQSIISESNREVSSMHRSGSVDSDVSLLSRDSDDVALIR